MTTWPKVGAPARPRECRPAGIPEGTTPPVLGSRKFMPPWAWNVTKRAPARAAKGGARWRVSGRALLAGLETRGWRPKRLEESTA